MALMTFSHLLSPVRLSVVFVQRQTRSCEIGIPLAHLTNQVEIKRSSQAAFLTV